jgi:putative ABC transport system ATP-binding protein
VLSLKGVRRHYGGREVLHLEDFEAAAGEHWLVLGASGSGKTTLLNLVAGLLAPSAGEITVGGQRLEALRGAALDRWRGRTVGIVPQKLHLIPSLTVLDNLVLASYLASLSSDVERARALLGNLDLEEKANSKPAELSHGQAQRVAVARAVMNRPKLLLADEPTSNLDDENCLLVLDLLQQQSKAVGATLIVATHDQRARQRFDRRLDL